MPPVNPEILIWARETAGLGLNEAAAKIGLKATATLEPHERIEAIERGEAVPTRAQLVRFARAYRRPLVTFYLERPPRPGDRGHDYRTTAGDATLQEQAWLDAIVRDVRVRHSLVRAALEDEEDVERASFVGQGSIRDGAEAVASRLLDLVQFDRAEFRRRTSLMKAFEYARERVEALGVFVLLIGDLGSHHTAVSTDTFRGYALADDIAPIIVLNDRDARSAWAFTLFHELCHLMLGESGVSGGYALLRVEQFCNDVASRILLGESELRVFALQANGSIAALEAEISGFARDRNLSRSLVAYRLLRADLIPEHTWRTLVSRFDAEWREHREREKTRARESEGGPSYYTVRRHRLGPALLETVNYLLTSGSVSVVKAAKILGVRASNVHETLSSHAG